MSLLLSAPLNTDAGMKAVCERGVEACRGGVSDEQKERYLCVGHLGRALPPAAQRDGENRKRVSERGSYREREKKEERESKLEKARKADRKRERQPEIKREEQTQIASQSQ